MQGFTIRSDLNPAQEREGLLKIQKIEKFLNAVVQGPQAQLER